MVYYFWNKNKFINKNTKITIYLKDSRVDNHGTLKMVIDVLCNLFTKELGYVTITLFLEYGFLSSSFFLSLLFFIFKR